MSGNIIQSTLDISNTQGTGKNVWDIESSRQRVVTLLDLMLKGPRVLFQLGQSSRYRVFEISIVDCILLWQEFYIKRLLSWGRALAGWPFFEKELTVFRTASLHIPEDYKPNGWMLSVLLQQYLVDMLCVTRKQNHHYPNTKLKHQWMRVLRKILCQGATYQRWFMIRLEPGFQGETIFYKITAQV